MNWFRSTPRRLTVPVIVSTVAAGLSLAVAPTAQAAPTAPYQMPFPCQEEWYGSTRSYHSPSVHAVDWNKENDLGLPVVASAPGIVTVADNIDNSGYGRWVMLDHGNGETTIYAHLRALSVEVGQRVDQAEQIGELGTTGNSSGPHLHFEERLDGRVQPPYFAGEAFPYGWATSRNCVDVPLAGNMVGDAADDLIIFERRTKAQFVIQRPNPLRKPRVIRFGLPSDDPVVGDWDGDGKANPGIRRAADRTFHLKVGKTVTQIVFGNAKDKPVAGDWDGDGLDDVGVWRAAKARFRLRNPDGTVTVVPLGDSDDLPVTGDWDGDGRTDVGVYDLATASFTLRVVDVDGLAWLATIPFGQVGDLPLAGDWDANGRTDVGVWNPATATLSQRFATAGARTRPMVVRLGAPRRSLAVFDADRAARIVEMVEAEDAQNTEAGTGHDGHARHDHEVPDGE